MIFRMGRKRYTTATISFSGNEDLLEDAKAKARAMERSLSWYMLKLLKKDLVAHSLELRETSTPLPLPPGPPEKDVSYREKLSRRPRDKRDISSVAVEALKRRGLK